MAATPHPIAGTVTLPKPAVRAEQEVVTTDDPGWKVLLFNDDTTPFDVVIYALQRAAGLSLEVAEAVALEAHTEGEAVVKRGLTHEDALIICGGLRTWSRVPSLCDGVACDAARDD